MTQPIWLHGFCAGVTVAALLTAFLALYSALHISGTFNQAEEEQERK